jgi:hypothetical protein
MMTWFRKYLLIVIITGILLSCTSNPFFKDDYYELEKVSGRVVLRDGTTPDSIFVWWQDLDLKTCTDSEGEFSLTMPPPEMQAGQAGLNGSYALYFYCANYALDSLTIVLTEGRLAKSQKNIDNDGRLRDAFTLDKLLDIRTEITPAEISSNWQDTLQVNVRLFSYRESLPVKCLIWNKPVGATTITYQSGIILRPINNADVKPLFLYNSSVLMYTYYLPNNRRLSCQSGLFFDAASLRPETMRFCTSAGWFKTEVPATLMEHFGYYWYWMTTDYLKIPMKRDCAILAIVNQSNYNVTPIFTFNFIISNISVSRRK